MADDLYTKYHALTKSMEPPHIYNRWCLLTGLAAYLGRQCWLPFGSSRIFPNQYVMLIGNPGARKSTAIKHIKKILTMAGYETFAAEKTSKEKFLIDLQGETGSTASETVTNLFGGHSDYGDPKECFVVADEFNEFTGSANTEFLSMLGALWDWDDASAAYQHKLKNAKSAKIYQPTINILSGNTHSGFAEAFPVAILGQGFMSRLVLVYSEPSGRKVTIPPVPPEHLTQSVVMELQAIKRVMHGPLTISPEAYSALDSIYKSWPELDDSRFKHYSTRRFTHLLKLCILQAGIRKSLIIGTSDVLMANTILSFTEMGMPKAMGELGRKRGSEAASTIMTALYETRRPLNAMDIWKVVEKDLDHMSDMMRILQNLQAAEKVQIVDIPGSRGEKGFLPKQKVLGAKNLYVDLKLLKGFEIQ